MIREKTPIKALIYDINKTNIVSRITKRLKQLFSTNERQKSERNMTELFLSEHENKITVDVGSEQLTGLDFLLKAIDQLEEAGDIRKNKLATMLQEVKDNDGRQFLVNYAQVPLGVPAVSNDVVVSFQGKGGNGN
ncbi:MAG: hypothetical protein KAI72_10875 [Candidatus Pacebacteria bacterium]|nr:hypothetical protein [Candidatus Paceibacterota bacterium]